MSSAPRTVTILPGLRSSMVVVGALPGTAKAKAVATALNVLCGDALPTKADAEVHLTSTLTGWVRRIAGQNLWLVYTFDTERVNGLAVIDFPP